MYHTQKEIERLLRSTERQGIEGLIEYMIDSGFFDSPASTKYHGAQPGGLAEHSLNVYNNAMAIAYGLDSEYAYDNRDSLIICSLLHDLGKVGQFGKPLYVDNVLKTGISKAQPYKINPELITAQHEVVSAIDVQRFIQLTEKEQRAILWHNGLYGMFKYDIQGKEDELYLIIHYADLWAARVTERGENNE